jgi:branched-chain amino acid transport system permease protein
MRIALQLLIAGFSLGSFYALIAMGFSIVFGVTHAFNLAHGEMVLFSGYLAYTLHKVCHLPLIATFPICMVFLLLGAILLHGLLKRLDEPFEMNTLVVTFGLALLLQNIILLGFSADYRLIPAMDGGLIHLPLADLTISKLQVLVIGLSLAATATIHLILRKTFLGKALRATIQDPEAAALAGIDVKSMNRIAFGLGGVFIGLAGPLYGQTTYLHPAGGAEATLIAIIVSIIAGVGRTRSILLGGWVLGLVESATALVLGSTWREGVSALLLIGLLICRPEGILSNSTDKA